MYHPRILVVNHDKKSRKMLQAVLEQHNYDVLTAASGEDMLKLLEEDAQFQLILLDFSLPGTDGGKLVHTLRSHPRTEKISVILMAEPAQFSQHGSIFWGGEVDFVAMPFQEAELLAHVAARLFVRRLKSEKRSLETRFEDLFNQVHDAVLVLDGNDCVIDLNWNACELFKSSRGELLTMKFSNLFSSSSISVEDGVANIPQGTVVNGHITSADGSLVNVEASVSPLREGFENTRLVVLYDLTPALSVMRLNTQSHQEALSRTGELEVLQQIYLALSSSSDLESALQAGLQTLIALLGFTAGWVTQIDKYGTCRMSAQHLLPTEIKESVGFLASCENCERLQLVTAREGLDGMVDECVQAGFHLSCIPIHSGETRIGLLHLVWQEKRSFSLTNRHLLTAIANQFAFTIERAHLLQETMKSLAREKRLNEVMQLINSTMDLGLILQDVVRLAADLTDADSGMIALLSAGGDQLVNMHRYNLPWGMDPGLLIGPSGFGRRVMDSGKPFFLVNPQKILDIYEHTIQAQFLLPSDLKKLCSLGLSGLMAIPIRSKEIALGLLALFQFNSRQVFEERELQLAVAMARQAGITIRNAQLFQESQKRKAEVETALNTSDMYSSPVQQHERIDLILEQLALTVPYENASVQILNGDTLEFIGGRGVSEMDQLLGEKLIIKNDGPVLNIFETRSPLILEDVQNAYPEFYERAGRKNMLSWMGLPLQVNGQIIGLLTLEGGQPGQFTKVHMRIASAFADEVALALDNVRVLNEMQRLAVTDPLTGLYNRRHFFDVAQTELERSRRYHHSMSIIILDVDHFKRVNDSFGHMVGDEVLRSLARTSLASLRKVDIMGRYGGEEFVVMLPETNLTSACVMAERLRSQVASMRVGSDRGVVSITISIGVAGFDGKTEIDLDTLLNRADQALYRAKGSGRNRYCLWETGNEEMQQQEVDSSS